MRKTKFIFMLTEAEISSGKAKTALVYDWEKKMLRFGGALNQEMVLRDVIKCFFGYLKIDRVNPIPIADYENEGRGKKGKSTWKIVFSAPCLNYVFKIAYRKMKDARASGGLRFKEASSIGRIFN